MGTTTARNRRGPVWPVFLLLALVVAGGGAFIWYMVSQVGTRPDGTRVRLVLLGEPSGLSIAVGDLPIVLVGDFAGGAQATAGGIQAEQEQEFFLRRERIALRIQFTAGGAAVDSRRLQYVLFDADGNELSRGPLRPDVQIGAGQTETLEIVDAEVPAARRVEIRAVP
jgi:hypothetical protein